MKLRKHRFVIYLFILFLSLSLQGQIPNGGFENWTLGDPDLWYTNNVIVLKPITQSNDAQVGSYSARLEILNNGGILQIGLSSTTDTGAVAYLDELSLGGTTDIDEINGEQIPNEFELRQNYPNPFNPTTNIEFSIPKAADIKLVVYNQLGQTIVTLVNEHLSTGSYSVDWNAEGLPSGVYFYRISADDFLQTRKLLLMK